MNERTDWHKLPTPELFEYRDRMAWQMVEVAGKSISGETMAQSHKSIVRWIDKELAKRQAKP